MATTFSVLKNRRNGRIVLSGVANGTISLADAAVDANDAIGGLNICRIIWSGGPWIVKRGANTVWTSGDGVTAGYHDFSFGGVTLNLFPAANITATSAAANVFIMIEANKGSFANGTYEGA